jgi:hypothetical protein
VAYRKTALAVNSRGPKPVSGASSQLPLFPCPCRHGHRVASRSTDKLTRLCDTLSLPLTLHREKFPFHSLMNTFVSCLGPCTERPCHSTH